MNKVIFLDIDGVIALDKQFMMNAKNFKAKREWANRLGVPYGFDEGAVQILNEILKDTDADIVLSSDWRSHWNLTELDEIFRMNGVVKSPRFLTHQFKRKMSSTLEDDRIYQITQFIVDNNIKNWVAIDDMDLNLGDRFFLTKSNEGIKRMGLKEKIINRLNSN